MTVRKRQREAAERQALERLRGRILSGIHAGHLNPGDRLPSYRQVAADAGVDLRAVARIYTRLAAEGLVEVRGKTGAYVAAQERCSLLRVLHQPDVHDRDCLGTGQGTSLASHAARTATCGRERGE